MVSFAGHFHKNFKSTTARINICILSQDSLQAGLCNGKILTGYVGRFLGSLQLSLAHDPP